MNLYYGGLDIDLIIASNAPVHLSLNSLVGAGAVGTRFALFSERDRYRRSPMDYGYHHHHHDYDGGGWDNTWWEASEAAAPPAPAADVTTLSGSSHMDGFFVVEPGVNLDFNMTHSFRLSLGGSYRWVHGVQSTASTKKQLTGPSAMVTFRFGSF